MNSISILVKFLIVSSVLLLLVVANPNRIRKSGDKNTYFGEVFTSGSPVVVIVPFNNMLYFGTETGFLYSLDPKNEKTSIRVVANINFKPFCGSIIFNEKLYIGSSDGKLYEFTQNNEELTPRVVADLNRPVRITGMTVLGDKIYFGGGERGKLYEFNSKTEGRKAVAEVKGSIIHGVTILNNIIYFGTNRGTFHEFRPATGETKLIFSHSPSEYIITVLTWNDKVYFGSTDDNIYEYDPETHKTKSVCHTQHFANVQSLMIFNNNFYYGTTWYPLGVYNPVLRTCHIVVESPHTTFHAINSLNNTIYIGSNLHLYEYYEEIDLNSVITDNVLNEITSNCDNAILNEVNFLNPDLDVSQLDVVHKTAFSATIKPQAFNRKYFGEVIVYFSVNLDKRYLNFSDLLIKGILLTYKRKHNENFLMKLKDINNDNIIFSNIVATKVKESLSTQSVNESICFGTLLLSKPDNKTLGVVGIPACEYSKELLITTDIVKVIDHEKKPEPGISCTSELGTWPFGGTGYLESITLSNCWNITDLAGEIAETKQVIIPSQSVPIVNSSKVNVTAQKEVEFQQIDIQLEQVIGGLIIATLVDEINKEIQFTVSVKEIMENLDYSLLLPKEIAINNDDGVTFYGKLVKHLKRDKHAHIAYSEMQA